MMADLSREQNRALTVFLDNCHSLSSYQDNLSRLKKNGAPLPTGFKAYSKQPFAKTKIPREKPWVWNQSNSKVSFNLPDGYVVTFRKISPRKKFQDLKAPSYKIWMYHIFNVTKGHTNEYFMWCERGCEGVATEIGVIFPQELTTDALSFLTVFIECPKVKKELGWC